jgi:alanine racemase
MSSHRTWLELDERALTENIAALRSLLRPEARFSLCVKGNAYGHGMLEVARIAARAGVDAFTVDDIDDALALRDLLPSALIVVLGYAMRDRMADAVANDVQLVAYDAASISALEAAAAEMAKPAAIHLKVETGTSRQGVLPEHIGDILQVIGRCPHVRLAGVSTHFANIEDAEDTRYATQQFSIFQRCVAAVRESGFDPEFVHCANSAASILYPDTHGTMARVGISAYGLWPSATTEQTARRNNIQLELRPVLSWKTRIAQVKSLPAGTPIGYGLTETLRKNSRVAVLPVGYYDGYDRGLSSVGEVLVSGTRCKVLGRVCMNMTMVDVSSVPQAEPEQEVVLLGRSGRFDVSAEELAERAKTIHYEVVTRLNPLLPRIVV